MEPKTPTEPVTARANPWPVRIVVVFLIGIAATTVWLTNLWLTERYTAQTKSSAEVRLALFSGSILSELQRNSVVPLLLSRDPLLIGALNSGDFTAAPQRLISYKDEIGAASIMLMDDTARVVAATDRSRIGEVRRNDPAFVAALRANDTAFTAQRTEAGAFVFSYARRLESQKQGIGVIVVEVDLRKLESRWGGATEAVMVTDSEGTVILTTEQSWRGKTRQDALATTSVPSAITRAIQAAGDWGVLPSDTYVQGQAVMETQAKIPFQGWRISSFTSFSSVRAQVNGVLALEITFFAIVAALAFYLVGRRATSKSLFFQRESADLRRLNDQLQREITEREKAERNLEVAEQTIAQSSKLAALGEMSAAVSHELNQPLAAMKTYLAGAKLLLQRRRPDEALSSFQRIDDLIERMGAITRQLKSYARKGDEAFEPVDMRNCLSSSLAMMEPQLKQMNVEITQSVPREPVLVVVDRLRLEQVIVNLLRNALDAMQGQDDRKLNLILSAGDTATLTVRDNGQGIEDLDALFEPFYTTKKPGDGIGLGLAISSGIVADLGGRLTARNGREEGAVFEVVLPIHMSKTAAAE
ncbi:MAG: sensor histidine kinase [Brevirhabdus sp.]